MNDRLLDEQERLIADVERQADAARRTWRFSLMLTVANLGLAMVPWVPQSHHLFGALTSAQAIAAVVPGQVAVYVSFLLFRRFGGNDRRYRRMEAVESFLLYASPLACIVGSGLPWSPLWSLCPFSTIFWALTKPFHQRFYGSIVAAAHGLQIAIFLVRGDLESALISAAVAVASFAAFFGVARTRQGEVFAEADLNVARIKVKESLLEQERERIARAVADSVAQRLAAIADDLEAGPVPLSAARTLAANQARTGLRELNAITAESAAAGMPATMHELARVIEARVLPLCVNVSYRQSLTGEPTAPISPAAALAATRIVQELVRNATAHGGARTVTVGLAHDGREVSIQVNDDGRGLQAEGIAHSTGGLRNAQRWSSEQGGTFHRVTSNPNATGTTLIATLRAT